MTFKSFLSAVGHDLGVGVKAVFNFLGSSQGQAAVAGTETAAATVATLINPAAGAAVTAFEGVFNGALKEVIAVEASASAAGLQSGTGAQKLAAVTEAIAPNVQAFLTSIGISSPTGEQVQTYSTALANGIVAILNAIPPTAATPTA